MASNRSPYSFVVHLTDSVAWWFGLIDADRAPSVVQADVVAELVNRDSRVHLSVDP